MQLRELTNSEFDNFSRNFNVYSMYQTKEYAFAMHNEGYETSTVGLFDNNELVGAALILIKEKDRKKFATIPRGYLVDYNDYNKLKSFTNLIKNFLEKRNVEAVKICPPIIKNIYNSKGESIYDNPEFNNMFNCLKKLGYYHLGYNNNFEALRPRYEAYIDLKDKTIIDLFRNIKREFKTKIRTAERKGIRVYRGKENSINELHKLLENKFHRKESYLRDIYKYFNEKDEIEYFYAKLDTKNFLEYSQKNFLLYEDLTYKMNEKIMNNTGRNTSNTIAKKMNLDKLFESCKNDLTTATEMLKNNPEGIVLAAILVVKHGKEANIFIDGYNEHYKYLNAKHYLLWTLIEKYKNEGYEKFNLGGIPSLSGNNPDYDGLKQFKLNFGADVIEYVGDFTLITTRNFFTKRTALRGSINHY